MCHFGCTIVMLTIKSSQMLGLIWKNSAQLCGTDYKLKSWESQSFYPIQSIKFPGNLDPIQSMERSNPCPTLTYCSILMVDSVSDSILHVACERIQVLCMAFWCYGQDVKGIKVDLKCVDLTWKAHQSGFPGSGTKPSSWTRLQFKKTFVWFY